MTYDLAWIGKMTVQFMDYKNKKDMSFHEINARQWLDIEMEVIPLVNVVFQVAIPLSPTYVPL